MRIPVLSTVVVTLLLSALPAGAATIGFENSVLNSDLSAPMKVIGVAFQNGHVDAVGIVPVSPYELAGLCAGANCLHLGSAVFKGTMTGAPDNFSFVGGGSLAPLTSNPASLLFSASFASPQDAIIVMGNSPNPTVPVGQGVTNIAFATLLVIPNITRDGVLTGFLTGVQITFGPTAEEPPNQVPEVPEPGSILLLASGLAGGLATLRRRYRPSQQ